MLLFALTTAIAVWVIFFDGADRLEGSFLSIFAAHSLWGPLMSSGWLRFFVGLGWFANAIVLLINRHGG